MQAVMETTVPPLAVVIVVGGGLAIWNAAHNDGLLVGWLLVFSLVTPWLLQYNLRLGIAEPFVTAGYVTLALLVGTVGYLFGVRLRDRPPADAPDTETARFSAVFGSETDRPVRWVLLLIALFVVPAILVVVAVPSRSVLLSIAYPVAWFYPVGDVSGRTVIGVCLLLGWTGLAAWPAARGNGVLRSWAVLFAPMFGTLVPYSILEGLFASDVSSPVVNDVLVAVLVAGSFSVILGALGFSIGVVVRRALTDG